MQKCVKLHLTSKINTDFDVIVIDFDVNREIDDDLDVYLVDFDEVSDDIDDLVGNLVELSENGWNDLVSMFEVNIREIYVDFDRELTNFNIDFGHVLMFIVTVLSSATKHATGWDNWVLKLSVPSL